MEDGESTPDGEGAPMETMEQTVARIKAIHQEHEAESKFEERQIYRIQLTQSELQMLSILVEREFASIRRDTYVNDPSPYKRVLLRRLVKKVRRANKAVHHTVEKKFPNRQRYRETETALPTTTLAE